MTDKMGSNSSETYYVFNSYYILSLNIWESSNSVKKLIDQQQRS